MRHQLVCSHASLKRHLLLPADKILDLPITDLYDTEGDGGFPGIAFKARPVVGGHFAFLALERACGGKAMQALEFLNEEQSSEMQSGRTDGEL